MEFGKESRSMKYILIVFTFIAAANANAQQITIKDEETGEPIELVTIASNDPKVAVATDENGMADITQLKGANLIEIRHVSYKTLKTSYSALANMGFGINLVPSKLAIDELVISANKWEQSVYEIPNKIIGIDTEEIIFNNPQTSADMLAATGEVFVQKSQYGGGSPKLRGFAANSVLMVIDGVRMNNAIYRSGNLQNIISVDPNALEGAEVVLGPGSVIYGSDALGGVMDFHTKSLHYSEDGELNVEGSFMGRYSSAGNEQTAHGDLKLSWNKLASYTSFSTSSFGDLRAGAIRPDGYSDFGKRPFYVSQNAIGEDVVIFNENENVQVGSAFDSKSFIQKLGYRFSDEVELSYGLYYSATSDIPRYDRLVETRNDNPVFAEWYYGPQKWMMHNARLFVVKETPIFNQLKLTMAYQDYEESRIDRRFQDDRLRTRSEKVDVYSLNLDIDKEFNSGNLFYGLEILHNDVSSDGIRTNLNTGEITSTTPRYPDGGSSYTSYAAYTNYKWNMSKAWVLNTGLRYSRVDLEAKLTDQSDLSFPFNALDITNDALNGSLGIVYSPKRNLKWNTAFATGFRSPNIDDVGKIFDFSDGEIQVPNAGLQPEFSYNLETGIESKIGDNWEIGITGFYTWLRDAMVRRDFTFNGQDSIVYDGELSKVVALTNAGEAIIYGGSVEMEYEIKDFLSLSGSVTWVDGEDQTNNEPLRHTTPVFGRVSIDYSKEKLRLSFYSEFNGARLRSDIPISEIDDKPFLYAQHNTDPGKDGSPAWYTLNIRGAYDFSERIQINGGIENILDHHYRPNTSGISAPGRNFILALRARIN